MAGIIHTAELTKHYGRVVGLSNLSLDVEPSEVLGFLGPNGSGKTTTIRLLLDLIHPTCGEAAIGGYDCQRQGVAARRLVGYLPGELPVYPELPAGRFLAYLARLSRQPIDASRLEALLTRFGVAPGDLRRPMRELSHGTLRKLGIIQALAAGPRVLILDEPTGGLDPLMIEAFAQTIVELKREGRTTVFLSSHVLSEVERLCDRVALIRQGQLAALTTLTEIQRTQPRRVTVRFSSPVSTMPPAVDGVALVGQDDRGLTFEITGPLGPFLHALGPLPVADLEVEQFSLEDYVLRLYAA